MSRMPRPSSRASLRRSESAPTLAPVWEPDPDGPALEDVEPAWLNSGQSHDPSADQTASIRLASASCSSFARLVEPSYSKGELPVRWQKLLAAVSGRDDARLPDVGGVADAAVAAAELVNAAEESLRQDAVPLRLRAELLEQTYTVKKEIESGRNWRVMEGIQQATHKNFSLKFVPTRSGRLRASGALDPLQLCYLICAFVDDVYFHPEYVCICMKWGMHEVDASHQLSAWVIDALRLIRELLPDAAACGYMRVTSDELQSLLLRTSCLDLYLQRNLFLDSDLG